MPQAVSVGVLDLDEPASRPGSTPRHLLAHASGLSWDSDLGFETKAGKTPHWTSPANGPSTFGHFGQSESFLWVDPDAAAAVV